ncbi:MAG: lexA 3 [Firmicutes bacterium]|nr:lexA 3 [Bacillota bacterium]
MSNEHLTSKQQEILDCIKQQLRVKGYPPSVREIGQMVGLSSSSTVHFHLGKLEALGLIRRDPTKPRAIELMEEAPWRNQKMIPVPLVGRVAAGQPILAVENIEETYPLPAELVDNAENVFMLTISGESMINAGILDGDYVVVKEGSTAENGDIVVALIDNEEATIKRFFREKGRIRLQPENDTMEPIYAENVSIVGKAIGLFRKM